VTLCEHRIVTLQWRDETLVGLSLSGQEVMSLSGISSTMLFSDFLDRMWHSLGSGGDASDKFTFYKDDAQIMDHSGPIGDLNGVILREKNYKCVSIEALLAQEASAQDLERAGVTVSQLKGAGADIDQLRTVGYTIMDLKLGGFSIEEFKASQISAADLAAAGFEPKELYYGGFSIDDLRAAGFSTDDSMRAGFLMAIEAFRKSSRHCR